MYRHITKALSALGVLSVTIALGAGTSVASANQSAGNWANSGALNASRTVQNANQGQNANSSSGNSGCSWYCTGGGGNITAQSQDLRQGALTLQWADSAAIAKQNAVNANVPVTIVGEGNVTAPSGSANQNLNNSANSRAINLSGTHQGANQNQNADSSSGNKGCFKFCTGGGGNITPQSQSATQLALTAQHAASAALAGQNATNANVPVTIVGSSKQGWGQQGWGSVGAPSGSANQHANNWSSSTAVNAAATAQAGNQHQNANSSSGNNGGGFFTAGGGGNLTPQDQVLAQHAGTFQGANSASLAHQLISNINSGVNIG